MRDKEILEKLMDVLRTNPNKLALNLGYKNHNSIYNIIKYPAKISKELVDRIIDYSLNVSAEFL